MPRITVAVAVHTGDRRLFACQFIIFFRKQVKLLCRKRRDGIVAGEKLFFPVLVDAESTIRRRGGACFRRKGFQRDNRGRKFFVRLLDFTVQLFKFYFSLGARHFEHLFIQIRDDVFDAFVGLGNFPGVFLDNLRVFFVGIRLITRGLGGFTLSLCGILCCLSGFTGRRTASAATGVFPSDTCEEVRAFLLKVGHDLLLFFHVSSHLGFFFFTLLRFELLLVLFIHLTDFFDVVRVFFAPVGTDTGPVHNRRGAGVTARDFAVTVDDPGSAFIPIAVVFFPVTFCAGIFVQLIKGHSDSGRNAEPPANKAPSQACQVLNGRAGNGAHADDFFTAGRSGGTGCRRSDIGFYRASLQRRLCFAGHRRAFNALGAGGKARFTLKLIGKRC